MKLAPLKQWFQRHPAVLGLSICGTLLFGLLVQEALLDRFTLILRYAVLLKDFRIAINHCLMAGYFPAAYYALLRGTRNTVHELENVLEPADDALGADSAVQIGKRTLFVWGLIGLLITVSLPYVTTQSPWDPSTWNPEVWWHRILGLFVGLWAGWLLGAVWDMSVQISRLGARIGSVDLLDLSSLSPFVKQGLLNALLIVGGVSVNALRLIEPQERLVIVIIVGICLPLSLLGLSLPVRGVHRRIREAKEAELEWTRQRIRQSRTLLQDGSADVSPGQMADLAAYLKLIEAAPEWPFQGSTIVQVMLYTLLPVASWFGNLLIEGVLARLLG
jgi:hypothetical protein